MPVNRHNFHNPRPPVNKYMFKKSTCRTKTWCFSLAVRKNWVLPSILFVTNTVDGIFSFDFIKNELPLIRNVRAHLELSLPDPFPDDFVPKLNQMLQ